ncbi:MAG: mucoidy inhibitor MuiA family protein [Wenzhouxiangella sp.]|nr:mucoidy inhibitor MuiA family protein [Wenzhouxiangella sp.]MCH8478610.1 mucoidy inhibitor MuiA family protein [Wenzhouxiangella sp.]TVR94055.1 MAG: mucoidy inhibitor MuiA family protein [Wenzhouxiangellaceae bacterium]
MSSVIRGLLGLLLVFAAEAAAESVRIEQVTVYPDRAEVVRLVEMEVASGEHRLRLADLPAAMDADTLRISVREGDGFALGGAELRRVRGAERVQPRARELEDAIRDLEWQGRGLDNRIEARNLQLRLIESVAAGSDESSSSGNRLAALESIGNHAEDVLAGRLALASEREALNRELERLRRELSDLGQAQRDSREALVDYRAEAAGTVALELRYVVSQAGWEALYEWRLDTDAGQLHIIQQAVLRQNSGEDWEDAELRVALGQPAAGGRLPVLSPWYIDIAPPPRPAPAMESEALDRAVVAEARQMAAPQLEGSEMAAAWRIPGRVSLPGDNSTRRFVLSEYRLAAEVGARTVPRRQARAWLFASAEYDGEAWLPPGRVSLFQDGSLVGQRRSSGLAPGATLEASFGVAERVEVSHRMVRDTRGSDGVIRRQNRLEREFEIEIVNRYSRVLEVTVLDQLPIPRDERIQVELSSDSRAPSVRDFDDQAGVVAWQDSYQPGQKRQIRFGYRALFPRDVDNLSGW